MGMLLARRKQEKEEEATAAVVQLHNSGKHCCLICFRKASNLASFPPKNPISGLQREAPLARKIIFRLQASNLDASSLQIH